MNKLQCFTHNDAGDDYSGMYPYTMIAYQFGKRIYRELTDARELLEFIEDNTAFSVSHVVSPNGKVWTDDAFRDTYNIAVGLVIPDKIETLSDAVRVHGEQAVMDAINGVGDDDLVIIDEEGVHYGRIEGNTLRRLPRPGPGQ